MRQWRSGWGERRLVAGHTSWVTAIAFSRDGKHVLTGSWDRTARSWEVFATPQDLIDRVHSLVPRCLAPIERASFHLDPRPPRWCQERNLWPYRPVDGYTPEPLDCEERLTAWWDWLAGGERPAPALR